MDTLGILDCRDFSLTDKGLNGIIFGGKSLDTDTMQIYVNTKIFDISYATRSTYPERHGSIWMDEETILTVACEEQILKSCSIGYKGKIETIELKRQKDTLSLVLNVQDEEYGYNNGKHSISLAIL